MNILELADAYAFQREDTSMYSGACIEARAALVAEVEKLEAENAELYQKLDALLAHCPNNECGTCGSIICDHKDPMHFHHDGCPSCVALGEK